ncbi:MAG: helix-turn-helix domain-containing protein [Janthinobacterium lividum]
MNAELVSLNDQLGEFLRYWRRQRGVSQLDLALEIDVSQRHLSFVESGRSVPSRKLLLALSDALNVPLRERNALFLAAGYAPAYQEPHTEDPSMATLMRAIDIMMTNHEPHPALLIDRYWNVLRTNSGAPRLFGSLIDLTQWPRPRNLLELVFHPDGLRPFVEDWEVVAAGLLQRVHREALGQVLDPDLQKLLARLRNFPGVAELKSPLRPESAVLPITFRKEGTRLSYFSLITTVGTPQSVTAQELRIECMYPIDVTEKQL